ncbi:MAG TPA: homoserine dehydrogenase, partial [Candidatus Sulfotelmatobacter sp.]|nr:homoserine dehydrogenase [Candidatus Sulfotelmatobacter sp.]
MANSIGVGLLGLGTVGSAVAERLTRSPRLMAKLIGTEIRLHRVAVRDPAKHRPVELPDEVLTTDPDEVVNDPEVDVVVEVMGGLEPARQMIQASLQGGKSVVTANKAVIARDGPALAGTATGNAGLWFEAAVGGAVPIISLLRHALLADRIGEVRGVVNGTTNFILGEMQKSGSTLEAAVAEAQRRGYAEADPSGDIDGDDAADKLAILVWLAFGVRLDQASIPREG